MKKLYLLLLIFVAVSELRAEINLDVRKLTAQDGLADNMVLCIHKDKHGFLWFGTGEGLSRYDGNEMRNFSLLPENEAVMAIQESSDRFFYLQTWGRMYCFDYLLETSLPFISETGKEERLDSSDFLLLEDSVLLICRGEQLQRIDLKEGRKINGKHDIARIKDEALSKICLTADRKSVYAISNIGTVHRISLQTGEVCSSVSLFPDKAAYYLSISSCSLYGNYLWITTLGSGLFVYNTETQQTVHLKNPSDILPTVISHNDVFQVVSLARNQYLALTWSGYTVLSYEEGQNGGWKTTVCNDKANWLSQNVETRMISGYYDPAGILWIGTHGGGVLYSDQRWSFFTQYHQELHNEIGGIAIGEDHCVYLATFHQGILKSNRPLGRDGVSSLKLDLCPDGNATYISAGKSDDGTLWFGSDQGVLLEFPAGGARPRSHPMPVAAWIRSIFPEKSSGTILLGTNYGFYRYDCNSETFEREWLNLPIQEIFSIDKDPEGCFWLGTNSGVVKVWKSNDADKKWEADLRYLNSSKLYGAAAYGVLYASDSCVYVATSKGLGIIHPTYADSVRFFTIKDGLCSNWINCVIEDDKNHIWLGSNSGISHYSRHQNLFYNYYIAGNTKSAYKYGSQLLFGGSRNLTCFNPEKAIAFFETTREKKVQITELIVDGEIAEVGKAINGQVILPQSLVGTERIVLSNANRNFSFAFSDLSFAENLQKYNYRLLPYQESWINCSTKERISYMNLPPGDYCFEIKPVSLNGKNEPVTSLSIRIQPPWFATWWFRCLIVIVLLATATVVYKKEKLRQRRRAKYLLLKHELALSNREWEQERKIKKEQEDFFIQTAHELRTPLTLILAPVQELVQQVAEGYPVSLLRKRLAQTLKQTKALHTLVDQLLYIHKMRSGMVKLSLSEIDIVPFAYEISEEYRDLSVINQIDFRIKTAFEHYSLWVDAGKLRGAISNLLSNAFKYTPQGGSITLSIAELLVKEDKFCTITVEDNGPGIPEDLLEHIFEPFFTGVAKAEFSTSQGIGLQIVKHTLELHHGMVKAESKPGCGCKFILYIPVGKEHFAPDEYETVPYIPEVAVPEDKEMDHVLGEQLLAGAAKNNHSLLIVEDNNDVREYIVSLFTAEYTVYEAINGEQGYEMAQKYQPDLIVSDIMMPVKDGIELVKDLHASTRTAHIPVIMLTAKGEDKDMIQATNLGVDDYLTKPFNPEVLKAKVMNRIAMQEKMKRFYSRIFALSDTSDEAENKERETFLQQVINVIEQNFADEQFDVSVLADKLHVSQPTLRRKIRKYSALSAIELIRSVRISKGAMLIQQNCYSIQEVSERVGYNDINTFRKHFVEQFGVQPSKFGKEVASAPSSEEKP